MITRRGGTTLNAWAGADLLWHGDLWRHWERQEDQDGGPAESDRRHHGAPHWILHHQWHWDHLLYLQVHLELIINIIWSSMICGIANTYSSILFLYVWDFLLHLAHLISLPSSDWCSPLSKPQGLMLSLHPNKSFKTTWCERCNDQFEGNFCSIDFWRILKTKCNAVWSHQIWNIRHFCNDVVFDISCIGFCGAVEATTSDLSTRGEFAICTTYYVEIHLG